MSLTYTTWKATIANETVITATDANFLQILPSCIDYAEQRIYRELNLLATVVRDTSARLSGNSRNFTLPSAAGRFVAVQGVNVFVGSTRYRLADAFLWLLDFLYPTETAPSNPSIPQMYAMVTDQTIVVGPAPDQNYFVEVIGTIRPNPLSESNTTTYLTLYLPDLFVAASMIFMSGYMRNFGAQADDPKMAQSWETQYGALLASADTEETRKRYAMTVSATPNVKAGP